MPEALVRYTTALDAYGAAAREARHIPLLWRRRGGSPCQAGGFIGVWHNYLPITLYQDILEKFGTSARLEPQLALRNPTGNPVSHIEYRLIVRHFLVLHQDPSYFPSLTCGQCCLSPDSWIHLPHASNLQTAWIDPSALQISPRKCVLHVTGED